jgi:hypothetical protein
MYPTYTYLFAPLEGFAQNGSIILKLFPAERRQARPDLPSLDPQRSPMQRLSRVFGRIAGIS